MKYYGVVVIGCGHIGQQHLLDIYYRDSIRIIGVVDREPARAGVLPPIWGGDLRDGL